MTQIFFKGIKFPVSFGRTFDGTSVDGEHEFKTGSEFGFKVTLVFKENSIYEKKQETFNNITEVHSNYANSGRVAIESDIHRTGFTYKIKDVETLIIEEATTKEKEI